MPWCDDCDRFLNPNSVNDDGSCPTCGTQLASAKKIRRARSGVGSHPDALAAATPDEDANLPTPWHFKVLVVSVVIYLGWRLVQGILWISHKL